MSALRWTAIIVAVLFVLGLALLGIAWLNDRLQRRGYREPERLSGSAIPREPVAKIGGQFLISCAFGLLAGAAAYAGYIADLPTWLH